MGAYQGIAVLLYFTALVWLVFALQGGGAPMVRSDSAPSPRWPAWSAATG